MRVSLKSLTGQHRIMSAILQYEKHNIGGLKTELEKKGYQINLTTEELPIDMKTEENAAVSFIEADKSTKPKSPQDVIADLKNLRYGILLRAFVYNKPGQAKADLEELLAPTIRR